jgi:hypothetical protein
MLLVKIDQINGAESMPPRNAAKGSQPEAKFRLFGKVIKQQIKGLKCGVND